MAGIALDEAHGDKGQCPGHPFDKTYDKQVVDAGQESDGDIAPDFFTGRANIINRLFELADQAGNTVEKLFARFRQIHALHMADKQFNADFVFQQLDMA